MQKYSRDFARVYDIELTVFAKKVAPIIENFYSKTSIGKTNKNLLDLCCGTGHLAMAFLERDYSVLGIDASEYMLAFALEHNKIFVEKRCAEFVLGDILKQNLESKFGLITCTYDSINHLENESELYRCFRLAFGSAVKGGYFVFDVNTRASLNNWNAINLKETYTGMMVSRGVFEEKNAKAVIRFSGFQQTQGGMYEKFEQIIYNTVFDCEKIERKLIEAGWSDVYFAGLNDLNKPILEPENINIENDLFIIARK